MCGVAGVISPGGITVSDLPAMADALRHRGPDSHGYMLYDDATGIRLLREVDGVASPAPPTAGFAHRRLSIIDLSAQNDQPLADPDLSCAITYNGEIYNYIELRKELESRGQAFRTDGDTEVVLRSYLEWGQECVERFNGMWAFALIDLRRRELFLSRDRFGIKPLFYRHFGDSLYFASEIKGLLAAASISQEPDEGSVAAYLLGSRTDQGEETFFEGIRSLKPAHNLTLPLAAPRSGRLDRYWRIPDVVPGGHREPAAEYRELFSDAVRLHARSDVPVGTCLSGGLDSSGIVCVSDRLRAAGEIPSYTHEAFGYLPWQEQWSEQRHMEEVAGETGARMTYVKPTASEFAAALPAILRKQDEPFGSASIAAQWFVFRAARAKGMKVMLDGQGADEVLGGYFSYLPVVSEVLLRRHRALAYVRYARDHRRMFGRLPDSASTVIRSQMPARAKAAARALLSHNRPAHVEHLAPAAGVATPLLLERDGDDRWPAPASLSDHLAAETEFRNLPALLRFEDRNSMAHSIEARVPYLDHRVVEFSARLPDEWKIRGVTTKRVLREALDGVIPEGIRTRTDKIGFRADAGVTWALAERHREELIANRTAYEERWFEPAAVRRLLDGGDRSTASEFLIWRIFSLKSWLRDRWGDAAPLSP